MINVTRLKRVVYISSAGREREGREGEGREGKGREGKGRGGKGRGGGRGRDKKAVERFSGFALKQ